MIPKKLTQDFELLAEAPNSIQKIRGMVLQLAVRGRLVPQKPNDEPASVLLKKIKAKKNKFLKDGKIKQNKPLPPINPENMPYELPVGWEWARLGSILGFQYGKGILKTKRITNGNIPIYGANGILSYHDTALVKKDCIVVGRKGSAGALNRVYEPCWPSDVTYYIIPPDCLNFEYCFIILKGLQLENLAKGIKPGINRNSVYFLPCAVPPFNEQKRIVAKTDELMKLCDDLEARQKERNEKRMMLNASCLNALIQIKSGTKTNGDAKRIFDNFEKLYETPENVDELRKTILQLAVQGRLVFQDPNDKPASVLLKKMKEKKDKLIKEGKIKKNINQQLISEYNVPYKLPSGWEWVRIGDAINMVNGRAFKPSEWSSEGLPIVRIQNLNNPNAKFNYCSETIAAKFHINDGDFLISWSGTPGTSFGSFIWQGGHALLNQHIFRCDIFYGYTKEYLRLAINAELDEMISQAHGGVGLRHITKGKLERILITLPPLNEQERIVVKVDELMQLCDELESKLVQSQDDAQQLIESVVNALFVREAVT